MAIFAYNRGFLLDGPALLMMRIRRQRRDTDDGRERLEFYAKYRIILFHL